MEVMSASMSDETQHYRKTTQQNASRTRQTNGHRRREANTNATIPEGEIGASSSLRSVSSAKVSPRAVRKVRIKSNTWVKTWRVQPNFEKPSTVSLPPRVGAHSRPPHQPAGTHGTQTVHLPHLIVVRGARGHGHGGLEGTRQARQNAEALSCGDLLVGRPGARKRALGLPFDAVALHLSNAGARFRRTRRR